MGMAGKSTIMEKGNSFFLNQTTLNILSLVDTTTNIKTYLQLLCVTKMPTVCDIKKKLVSTRGCSEAINF